MTPPLPRLQDAFRVHSPSGAGGGEGRRVLLASILYNSNEILPNMVHQILQLAVALPHG